MRLHAPFLRNAALLALNDDSTVLSSALIASSIDRPAGQTDVSCDRHVAGGLSRGGCLPDQYRTVFTGTMVGVSGELIVIV